MLATRQGVLRGVLLAAVAVAVLGPACFGPGPAVEATTDVIFYTKDARPFAEITGKGDPRGYSIDLAEEVLTYIYGSDFEVRFRVNDTNPEMIEGVRKNADAADLVMGVAATTMTVERESMVHFLPAFFQSGLRILTPTSSSFFDVLVSLLINTVYTCGVAFFTVLFLVFMSAPLVLAMEVKLTPEDDEYLFFTPARDENGEEKSLKRIFLEEISVACGWVMYAIMRRELPTPKNPFGKATKSILGTIGLLLIIMMTATLTTAMSTDVASSSISEFEDLSGKDVCTVTASSAETFLDESNIGIAVASYSTIDDAVSAMLDDNDCVAVVYDAAILQDVMVERDGNGKSSNAVFVDDFLRTEWYGFFVNDTVSDSDFEALKQAQIAVMNDADTIEALEDKWLGDIVGEEFSGSFSLSEINIWIFIVPLIIGCGWVGVTIYSFLQESYVHLRQKHVLRRRSSLADTQDWVERYHSSVRHMRTERNDVLDDSQDVLRSVLDTTKEIDFVFLTDMALRNKKVKTVRNSKADMSPASETQLFPATPPHGDMEMVSQGGATGHL